MNPRCGDKNNYTWIKTQLILKEKNNLKNSIEKIFRKPSLMLSIKKESKNKEQEFSMLE